MVLCETAPQVVVSLLTLSFSNGAVSAFIPHMAITITARTPAARASGAVRRGFTRCSFRNLVNSGVHDMALLECGPEGPVQAVLEVEVVAPLHDVGEQVAEEGRVLIEECGQLEGV